MTLTIELPEKLDAALKTQARTKGLSEAGLIQELLEQVLTPASIAPGTELPALHLGPMDSLHRRDIYDDAR